MNYHMFFGIVYLLLALLSWIGQRSAKTDGERTRLTIAFYGFMILSQLTVWK